MEIFRQGGGALGSVPGKERNQAKARTGIVDRAKMVYTFIHVATGFRMCRNEGSPGLRIPSFSLPASGSFLAFIFFEETVS